MNKSVLSIATALLCASAASAQGWPGTVTLTYAGGTVVGGTTRLGFNSGVYAQANSWSNTAVSFSFTTVQNQGLKSFGLFNMYAVQFQGTSALTPGSPVSYSTTAVSNVPDGVPPAVAPMGVHKAALISDLYARFFHSSQATSTTARAFQLAIYEIVGENTNSLGSASAIVAAGALDLSKGAFRSTTAGSGAAISGTDQTAIFNTAQGYLSQLGTGGFKTSSVVGMTAGGTMDQLLMVPIGAPGIIAGLGLVGVVALRRRRK